jgi:hypothetical protein
VGPRAGLDTEARRKILVSAEDRTPVVQYVINVQFLFNAGNFFFQKFDNPRVKLG